MSQLKVSVKIISAKGLGNAKKGNFFSRPNPYCVCEVPDKPTTRFATKVMVKSTNPKWNHEQVVKAFEKGDTLHFKVMDNQVMKKDKLLGEVTLSFKQVISGFQEEEVEIGDGGFLSLHVYPKASAVLKEFENDLSSGDDSSEKSAEPAVEVPQDRKALTSACFKMLANDKRSLNARDTYELVLLFDYNGTFDDWSREYPKICQAHRVSPDRGVSEKVFGELIDDRRTIFYCGNGDLKLLFSELQHMQSGSEERLLRQRLLDGIFELVDIEENKLLNLEEMRKFARAVGFPGSDDDWAHEFRSLCAERGWNSKVGINRREFKQLVNDEDGGVYCNDENLVAIKRVLESQAKARLERMNEIGDLCFETQECMYRDELYEFFEMIGKLQLVGITENDAAWEKEYLKICKKFQREPESGISRKNWTVLLNQKSSWTYCKDREMGQIVKHLKQKLNPPPEDRGRSMEALFNFCDADQDGLLIEQELRRFAVTIGWKGSRHDWTLEYKKVCNYCKKKTEEGLDLEAFLALVDDQEYEHGVYYCSDEMLKTTIAKFHHHDQNSASRAPGAVPSRREQAEELFKLYDLDGDFRLREEELRVFAVHIGFQGSEDEWTEEYRVLCLEHGWNMQAGLSVESFFDLIDSKESGAFRTNEEIAAMLKDHQDLKEGRSGGQLTRRTSKRYPGAQAPQSSSSAFAQEIMQKENSAAMWAGAKSAVEGADVPGKKAARSRTPPGRGAAGAAPAASGAAVSKTHRSATPGKGKTAERGAASRPSSTSRMKPGGPRSKNFASGGMHAEMLKTAELESSELSETGALKQRAHLMVETFRACDRNDDGRLHEEELQLFASAVGFHGKTTDWDREYHRLCSENGWDAEVGLDTKAFCQLVDTPPASFIDSVPTYYCNNAQLQAAREKVLWKTSSSVKADTILICIRLRAVKITLDGQVVGTVLPGSYLTASAPAEKANKTIMIPVRPEGAVPWAFFRKAPMQMSRDQLIQAVFVACDANRSGFLREAEMYRLAQCMSFPGSQAEWSKEYRSLCNFFDVNPSAGLTEYEFVAMVGHDQSTYYCNDQRLATILGHLPNADLFRGRSDRKGMLLKRKRSFLEGWEVAAEAFRTLDLDADGRVSEEELKHFAACFQGDGDGEEFLEDPRVREYSSRANLKKGLDIKTFCQLVSDVRSPFHCEADKLASIGAAVAWDVRTTRQRDGAVTRIQAAHRGKVARNKTNEMRVQQNEERKKAEAAAKIQKWRRESLAVKERVVEQGQDALRRSVSFAPDSEDDAYIVRPLKQKKKGAVARPVGSGGVLGYSKRTDKIMSRTDSSQGVESTFLAQNVAQRSLSSHTGNIELRITIESARGLRSADLIGKSDPYCICGAISEKMGKSAKKIQTSVIYKTLDPIWNFSGILDYVPGDSLEFCVWDKDPAKRDDFLGRASFLSSQFRDGFAGEVELADAGKKTNAFLRVRIVPRLGPAAEKQALEEKIRDLKNAAHSSAISKEEHQEIEKELQQLLAAQEKVDAVQELIEKGRRAKEDEIQSKTEAEAVERQLIAKKRADKRQVALNARGSWFESSKSRYQKATADGELGLQHRGALLSAVQAKDEIAALAIIEHSEMGVRFFQPNRADYRECTVFHVAAENGLCRVLKALLARPEIFHEAGKLDFLGLSALHRAARHGEAGAVKVLMEHENFTKKMRHCTNQDGWTALHLSAFHGHEATVELLLNHPNFDMNDFQDKAGRTALHCAASKGWTPLCDLIAEHPGFTRTLERNCQGMTAAETAAAYHSRKSGHNKPASRSKSAPTRGQRDRSSFQDTAVYTALTLPAFSIR